MLSFPFSTAIKKLFFDPPLLGFPKICDKKRGTNRARNYLLYSLVQMFIWQLKCHTQIAIWIDKGEIFQTRIFGAPYTNYLFKMWIDKFVDHWVHFFHVAFGNLRTWELFSV